MKKWTRLAVAFADQSPLGNSDELTEEHIENLAECALGPTRKRDGVEDRPFHLEHIAAQDVPCLIREIVRLRKLVSP